ncbi:MAG: GNAT family N-acetyltransferase [Clostridia bacterium]|nr:GNAT family N-acetyltransferase [Clostridia bacterium]
MIKLIEEAAELGFLPDDAYCSVITAVCKTYGTGYDFARFYRGDNNTAFSVLDGNVVLWANENADLDEIKAFLGFSGYSSLKCDEKIMKALGMEVDDSAPCVEYTGDAAPKPCNFVSSCDAREIYSLLVSGGFELGNFESFCEDVILRLNKGTADFGGIYDGGLRACAFRLFNGSRGSLLGAVTTDPDFRGRGLASELVPYMANNGKPCRLFCRNEGLIDFYTSCGFTPCGRWAINYHRGNQQ